MLIRLAKNLVRAQQIIHEYPRLYQKQRNRWSLGIARSLLFTIRRHARLQDLNWEPLAPAYKAWKEAQGLDTRTWIATHELLNLIKIIPVRLDDGGTMYLVGLDPVARHYSGMSAYELALVHEYGVPDLGIPARPLFRPSYHEVAVKYKARAKTANRELYEKYFRTVRR